MHHLHGINLERTEVFSLPNYPTKHGSPYMSSTPAVLALENGTSFNGDAIGALGAECTGEIVFNTAMTGYQEILTDPSYSGQVVTFTYPHIGNYGVNEHDVESGQIQAAGLVVRELSRVASNFRSQQTLQSYLEAAGTAGISGLDTRALVRILRDQGAMRCVIAHGDDLSADDLVDKSRALPSMTGLDLTPGVTTSEIYRWTNDGVDTKDWYQHGVSNQGSSGKRYSVVAVDYGVKRNILRRLTHSGCDVTVVPATTSAEAILDLKPDGVFLSNGPGDPAAVTYGIDTVQQLVGKTPIFGICLGHQILSLAVGAKTYKLKFGHRGANHPVRNLVTGAIEITSQNHGFAVENESLPNNAELTHMNLNDNTCAGIRLKDAKAFAVQYHPEASPGPHDSDYLFQDFLSMMQ